MMRARVPATIILVLALLAAVAGAARTLATGRDAADWPMIGQDPSNSRNQPLEHQIRPANAASSARTRMIVAGLLASMSPPTRRERVAAPIRN